MKNKLKVASVQMEHVPDNKRANLDKMKTFVRAAVESETTLIVFPEMCVQGYWHLRHVSREELESMAEPLPGGEVASEMIECAVENRISIGFGLVEKGEDGRLFNSYAVAMHDGTLKRHRKLHCFVNEHLSSGDEYTVFDLPEGWKTGLLICYDLNIGENVRINALKGAELLLAPHQTGGCETPSPRCMGVVDRSLWENRLEDPDALRRELMGPKGRQWIHKWLPARAHDNGMFLIFSNGIGKDDNEIRTGNAVIFDPYGDILAESNALEDDMIQCELDPTVREMATGWRWIQSRRPELYQPLVTPTGQEKDIRTVRFSKTLWNDLGGDQTRK